MFTWSISWNAWRSAIEEARLPLTAMSGLAARYAVAMPVSELVWPGPPVTSDSAGRRWMRAQASAACVTPDSCRMSVMGMPARAASASTSLR